MYTNFIIYHQLVKLWGHNLILAILIIKSIRPDMLLYMNTMIPNILAIIVLCSQMAEVQLFVWEKYYKNYNKTQKKLKQKIDKIISCTQLLYFFYHCNKNNDLSILAFSATHSTCDSYCEIYWLYLPNYLWCCCLSY